MSYREPSADMRKGASQLREFYEALLREGFSEEQATRIVCAGISGRAGSGAG